MRALMEISSFDYIQHTSCESNCGAVRCWSFEPDLLQLLAFIEAMFLGVSVSLASHAICGVPVPFDRLPSKLVCPRVCRVTVEAFRKAPSMSMAYEWNNKPENKDFCKRLKLFEAPVYLSRENGATRKGA